MSDESFTFNYSDKRGMELKFMHREKRMGSSHNLSLQFRCIIAGIGVPVVESVL